VSHSIQAVIAIGGSDFFFDSSQAIIAYPRAKVGGDFGGKPDRSIFGKASACDGLRSGRSSGIRIETCAVLEKSRHVDGKDLFPSKKAGSKNVPLLCNAARLSSSWALGCGFHLPTNPTPTYGSNKIRITPGAKIMLRTAVLPILIQEKQTSRDLWRVQIPRQRRCGVLRLLQTPCGLQPRLSLGGTVSIEMQMRIQRSTYTRLSPGMDLGAS
jgi:hypothetical protein